MVGFGAGSLIFAVSVDLFGSILLRVEAGTATWSEVITQIVSGIAGTLLFMGLNRVLMNWGQGNTGAKAISAKPRAWRDMRARAIRRLGRAALAAGTRAGLDIRREMSAEERAEVLTEAFKMFSGQHYGQVSLQELHEIFIELGYDVEEEEVAYLMEDAGGSPVQALTLPMFITAISTFLDSNFTDNSGDVTGTGTKRGKVAANASLSRSKPARSERSQSLLDKSKSSSKRPSPVLSIWLGIALDGIPEAILVGALVSSGHVSLALILSIFFSDFPEAFSCASISSKEGLPVWKTMSMWSILVVLQGLAAMFTAVALGDAVANGKSDVEVYVTVIVEGLAGGAMLSCVIGAMVPEAVHHGGDTAPLVVVSGFVVALFVKVCDIRLLGGGHGSSCNCTGITNCTNITNYTA
jgi:zinc transporter ZupT